MKRILPAFCFFLLTAGAVCVRTQANPYQHADHAGIDNRC
jgi:hypothetical protein